MGNWERKEAENEERMNGRESERGKRGKIYDERRECP